MPFWALLTLRVVVPIWVSEPGNPLGKLDVVYSRTVTGWVTLAVSTPKETEVTEYSAPPVMEAMLNALQ